MNKPVACRHCGHRIIACRCVAHTPPLWRHHGTGYHRCGPSGVGDTFAEPAEAVA